MLHGIAFNREIYLKTGDIHCYIAMSDHIFLTGMSWLRQKRWPVSYLPWRIKVHPKRSQSKPQRPRNSPRRRRQTVQVGRDELYTSCTLT